MPKTDEQRILEAWEEFQMVRPYVERFQVTAQIDQNQESFKSLCFCLSCGFWVENEQHQCVGRVA